MEQHTCLRCSATKGADEFYPHNGKVTSTCKVCVKWENATRAKGLPVPSRRDGIDGSMRRCRVCDVTKALDQFAVRDKARGTRRTECRDCMKQLHRSRYHANRPLHRARMRRSLYGLELGQYEAMLAAQGGVCAICGEQESSPDRFTGSRRQLFVDHCHETGAVRGLLCMRCNIGVGQFRDRVDLLAKAIDYLKNSAA